MNIFQNEDENLELVSTFFDFFSSIWFWIAMFELVIIIYLIIKTRQVKQDLKFSGISRDKLKTMKKSNIDMNNLMSSINNSKELYKQLSKACHPDRFVNTEFEKKANDIFQEISKNKRDFNKLSMLKKEQKQN